MPDAKPSNKTANNTVESLERRLLLDATPFAVLSARGTLGVLGTGGDDQITITAAGNQIDANLNGQTLQFPAASVLRIYITASGGNDNVAVDVARKSTLLGSPGNDTLTGGSLDDSLDGGTGDDVLNGEAGNDTLLGGDGNDTAEWGDRSQGFNFNFPDSSSTDPLLIASATANDRSDYDSFHDIFETIGGTEHADNFNLAGISFESTWPGSSTLVINARGGDDQCRADTGADSTSLSTTFNGGDGNDYMEYGFDASTTFFGDAGNDTLFFFDEATAPFDGGPGTDEVDDGGHFLPGLDLHDFPNVENASTVLGTLIGNDGANVLTAEGSSVTILGEGGNDTIISGDNSDEVSLNGGDGNDSITGSPGADQIDAGAGNDTIHAGDGDDLIVPGPGNDHVFGEAGDDFISARDSSPDTLDGGAGNNTASADPTIDTLTSISPWIVGKVLTFASGFDINVSEANNQINIATSSFTFSAAASSVASLHLNANTIVNNTAVDSVLVGDQLTGGSGNDLLHLTGYVSSASGGAGDDTIFGSSFQDSIDGGAGNDRIHGGDGNDTITGGSGHDHLYGDNGDDVISAADAQIDTLDGGAGTDTLFADVGVDLATNFEQSNNPSTAAFVKNQTLFVQGTPFDDDIQFNESAGKIHVQINEVRLIEINLAFRASTIRGISVDAGAGDDYINDYIALPSTLMAGNGNDHVYSDAGDDLIIGGSGTATLYAHSGPGNDTIEGTASGDALFGDAGNDVINAGRGNDAVHGGDSDDTIVGGKGHDRLNGDAGNDQLLARDNQIDTLNGGDGTDQAAIDNTSKRKDLWTEIETLL